VLEHPLSDRPRRSSTNRLGVSMLAWPSTPALAMRQPIGKMRTVESGHSDLALSKAVARHSSSFLRTAARAPQSCRRAPHSSCRGRRCVPEPPGYESSERCPAKGSSLSGSRSLSQLGLHGPCETRILWTTSSALPMPGDSALRPPEASVPVRRIGAVAQRAALTTPAPNRHRRTYAAP
jgi:hypothetical protein